MLNKHLLRFRRSGSTIVPQFINSEEADLLELATALIEIYDADVEISRSEIDEQTLPLINSFKDVTLARGLNKLMQDRSVFSQSSGENLSDLRRRVFLSVSKWFGCNAGAKSLSHLQNFVVQENENLPGNFEDLLYADLPEFEVLKSVKKVYAKELLERYNVSLVQSLLLNASSLSLVIQDSSSGKLRKLFKYLKFFQLLATIKVDMTAAQEKKKNDALEEKQLSNKIRIEVDGPLSLFENSARYGLRIASFFPAICEMDKWQLKCSLKIDGKQCSLNLSQKFELKSHYRNFSSYLPEEVKVFHRVFKEKVKSWQVMGETPFLRFKGQEVSFPDLCFLHSSGKVVFLELFHRWHVWQLRQRLELVLERSDMIVGIDRALYKREEIKEYVDKLEVLNKRAFLFNDFPVCSVVEKLLDNCL